MADTTQDNFHLQRFLDAQASVYGRVCQELRDGHKRTHWMWYIFPQISGLGHSEISRHFAIASRAEALAFLHHPVLGARLVECTTLVNAHQGPSAHQIFGSPDDMKFHSCMTLFAAVAEPGSVFHQALAHYFGSTPDSATLERL